MTQAASIILSVLVLMNVWCVVLNLRTRGLRSLPLFLFNLGCALFGAWTVWELGFNK